MSLGLSTHLAPFSKINIKSRRLRIRPFLLTDFENCKLSHEGRMSLQNDFDEINPLSASKTYESFRKRILNHREKGRKRTHYILGVFETKSGSIVGQVDLFQFNAELKWMNLGYQIQNQYWGRGYATESCKALMKYAFKYLPVHRIEASMFADNIASESVAKKLDLVYEGSRNNFFPGKESGELRIYAMNKIDAMR